MFQIFKQVSNSVGILQMAIISFNLVVIDDQNLYINQAVVFIEDAIQVNLAYVAHVVWLMNWEQNDSTEIVWLTTQMWITVKQLCFSLPRYAATKSLRHLLGSLCMLVPSGCNTLKATPAGGFLGKWEGAEYRPCLADKIGLHQVSSLPLGNLIYIYVCLLSLDISGHVTCSWLQEPSKRRKVGCFEWHNSCRYADN